MRSAVIAAATLALAQSAIATPAAAQGGILLQGIVEAELWSTDTLSNMLTRNAGRPGGAARLALWGAADVARRLTIFAQVEANGGPAASRHAEELDVEMLGLRWAAARGLVIDAGRITYPLGEFSARRFANRNPVIGVPDAYPVTYPEGVQASGRRGMFDYKAAALNRPVSHPVYFPAPDAAWRPALAFGVSPFTGLRVGGAFSWGPYLNASISAAHYDGADWRSFHQRVAAVDVAFSRGYLDVHAEVGANSYDVPKRDGPIDGFTWYADAKYTVHPRAFVAVRVEYNDYPFIAAVGGGNWVARSTWFHDAEAAVGWRLTATTLVKASLRADDWNVTPENAAFIRPGGRAFALQLSQSFDVMDWVDAARLR